MKLKSALLDRIAVVCRRKGYSPNTAQTYRYWCSEYLWWLKDTTGQWVDPARAGRDQVEQWLTHLATVKNVSPTSQNTGFQAVLFMYRELLDIKIENVDSLRARGPKRIPTVLSVHEVTRLLHQLQGRNKLIAQLLYGCGLRIGEAVSLRLKDVDIDQRQVIVRHAKGAKDRAVMLPQCIEDSLALHIRLAAVQHQKDTEAGCCRVEVPYAFARKSPSAPKQLGWFWLFPSHQLSKHPTENWVGRYHINESNFGRSLKLAAARAGILKRVSSHTMRHSFATHSLNNGVDIRSLQQLMGHNDVRTTMIYTHVETGGVTSERSPLDCLPAA